MKKLYIHRPETKNQNRYLVLAYGPKRECGPYIQDELFTLGYQRTKHAPQISTTKDYFQLWFGHLYFAFFKWPEGR